MTNSITLVGRATALEFRESEDGHAFASFALTTKPWLTIPCVGTSTQIMEQFELMDEGCFVKVIGALEVPNAELPLVRIDHLEYLGGPVDQEVAA